MTQTCVVGIDPGLTRCGIGVVRRSGGTAVKPLAVDVVRTPADTDIAQRLLAVAEGVAAILDRYRPEAVAIERVFTQHNRNTAAGTAMAAGVAATEAARRSVPVTFYTPSEVKAAVSGNGRADKSQVTAMVTRILGLVEPPRPADAADALAIAICHLWRYPLQQKLRTTQPTSSLVDPVGVHPLPTSKEP